MKIRSGFVSNSSSSSFILSWNDKDFTKCECCGYIPQDPVTLCENETECYSGDSTQVIWADVKSWIDEYQEEIERLELEIESMQRRNPSERAYQWSTISVGEQLASLYSGLAETQRHQDNIKKWAASNPERKIASVEISYHSPLNHIIGDMVTRGIVQKICASSL